MRIAILNHYASLPEIGSSETRHFELAKRFVSDGHSVHIYVGDFSHLNSKRWSESYNVHFEVEGVEFFVIKTRKYSANSLARFLSCYDYLKNGRTTILHNDYDVVISSSPHPFAWSLGWYYCKKKKGKFVIEIRDTWPDDLVSLGMMSYAHPVAKFFTYMCKKYYPKSSAIISLVPDLSTHFKRLGFQHMNCIYIPNGVDLEMFTDSKPCGKVDEIFSRTPQKVRIIYAGSIVPHNGIREFIELINQIDEHLLRHFAFLFIGPSHKEYLSQVKAIAKDNVFFFDSVPKDCVPYLFSKSDVLLFTLSQTQMTNPAVSSYKVLDYMASGKPILSVDIDGLLLKLTNGALFYKNNDHKSLEKALKQILNQDLSDLGKKNVEYIKKERTWEIIYQKMKKTVLS
ncbi:MAG TPA: glycosyltransferase family 4 protein [Pseudothermotoga sp.]|nr:glycosyltransferase family 4 protein [Pseudothermotoga sp.]